MGTNSNIYAELPDGTWVGSYCHWDGYPSHMFLSLRKIRSPVAFHLNVHRASMTGGIRVVRHDGTLELYNDASSEPDLFDSCPCEVPHSFAYRVYQTGHVEWATDSSNWTDKYNG